MGPGQHPDFAMDRTEVATVRGRQAVCRRESARGPRRSSTAEKADFTWPGVTCPDLSSGQIFGGDPLEQFLGGVVAIRLAVDLLELAEFPTEPVVERAAGADRPGVTRGSNRQPAGGDQLMLERDDLLVDPVSCHDRFEHLGLGQLFAESFDHHDPVFGARDDQVEIAFGEFIDVGQGDQFPFHPRSRTEPIGPRNGSRARTSEAEAPIIDRTSASFLRSDEIGPAWIWTSSR